jgi:Na+-driven multidrug efflux pump
LVLLIISSAINIVLDYVLIVYVHMGVGGAAVATVVSQGVSGVFCLLYIVKKVPLLHISRRNWVPDAWCMKNQLMIGIPMALQFSITAVGTILVQAALNLLGSTAVAAYSVACKVEQLVTQPFLAMGSTMATYSAQNRGINDLQRIRQGVKVSNRMSAIYSIVIYFVICSLLPYAIRLFITENIETVYGYAEIYIRICGLFFIPLGMIFIYRNTMQGCGFAFWPMMGGVVELLVRCVAAFVATKMLSYEGVCIANAGAWLGAGLFLWICYHYVMRRMIREKQRFDEVSIKPY